MSGADPGRLPPPRNIRKNWKARPIDLNEAAAHVSVKVNVPERYGHPVEARAWEMTRGWRRGMIKRVDIAYEGEEAFASVRYSGQFYTLKFGPQSVR